MTGLNALKAYQQAHRKALELHYRWKDLEDSELLALFEKFQPLANDAISAVGEEWAGRADLKRHLGYMGENLKSGKKDSSNSDVNDLIYADFPSMLAHIVREASKSAA